jgi:hypothetical protein
MMLCEWIYNFLHVEKSLFVIIFMHITKIYCDVLLSYIMEEVINITKLYMKLFYYVCVNCHVSYALCISYFQNMF